MTNINLRFVILVSLILCGLVFYPNTSDALAAASLTYFNPESGDQEVTLYWKTDNEVDTVGFFVQRSSQNTGPYERINSDMIPATGDSHTGASYEFTDTDVTNGVQYWYKIEIVDFDQNSELSDPVSAIPALTINVTGTTAPTSTSGGTNTNQSFTATPGSTIYPGLTETPMPTSFTQQIPISTGSVTVGDQETSVGESIGSTATLVPLPTITIIFPTPDSNNLVPLPEPIDNSFDPLGSEVWSNLWPIGLIILIWLGLGIWFFLLRRHMN